MSGLTRRGLLKLGLLGGIAGGLTSVASVRDNLRFYPALLRAQWLRVAGKESTVAVVRCPSYADAAAAVRQAWDLAGGPSLQGKRVVLKPNLIDYLPDRPIHTAPELLGAAVEYVAAHGASEIVVADGSGFSRDSDQLLESSGLGATLRRVGVPFVDLNYDDLDEVPLKGNYGRLKSLSLPRTITRADVVVSVPKMKTHHWAGVSLSMKNLFGVVPGIKYGWPKNTLHWNGITASILTLTETVRPQLALIDGVIGMEGDGPIYGTARPSGVVLAGTDLVAVDATAARVMGIDVAEVEHLRLAGTLGMGNLAADRVVIRGVPLDEITQTFKTPPRMTEAE